MFRRLPEPGAAVDFTIDGRMVAARAGDTVAAALLANGILACGTRAVSARPRAPWCLMGVCFECLVTIDGVPSRQACLVRLAPGMRVETQPGRPAVAP